jgi:hypothetical protein
VLIVGAGAAGLAAGIFTRRLAPALRVTVVDGALRPGAKILVSGGSRCNVTNRTVTEQDFNGGKGTIVRRVLRALPVPETIKFFDDIGVPLHEEALGKLFPDTNRSRDVLDALLRELGACGAVLEPGVRVDAIVPNGDGFDVHAPATTLRARMVVLATGGRALPKSGSDGAGLEMARGLGHTIVPTTPALVPLVLAEGADAIHPPIAGVSHPGELTIWTDGAVFRRVRGALLWTHFGISGPAALDASRHWLRPAMEGRAVRLTLSFCPGDRFEQVDARWTAMAAERPRLSIQNALATLLPASVASIVRERLGLDAARPLAQLTRDERRRVSHALVEWPLDVTGSRGYTYAEVTAGGVSLEEIDPATMASRRCPGLYLVGEILDVDGRLGGFNFQWAWASGRAAASGIARATG